MAQISLIYYFMLLVFILLATPLNQFSPIQPVASLTTNETKSIQKICIKTLEPYDCFRCISADTSRDSDDTPELIHSLLHCMYSEANLAHINADLLSQNSSVPTLKAVLSQCSSLLLDAANLAVNAMTSMENNKYMQAWDFSRSARRSMVRCAKSFLADSNLSIPASVLDPMIHAKRSYDSMHVLFQLIVH